MNKSNSGENEDFNATLFDARNFYYIGNFMGSINTVLPEQTTGAPELLAYSYYSYLAIESGRLITSEIKNDNPTALLAFRYLYEYLNEKSAAKREEIVQVFVNKVQQDVGSTNIWLVIAAIVFSKEEMYENALKALHGSDDLECMALSIFCLLKLHRTDQAKLVLAKMQEKSDDATLTQLAQAWVAILSDGDQLQDAFHIFQEFCEKYSSTPLLLNGQAVCHIGQEKYEEAEDVLKEALSKKHNDYDTLVNLVVLSHLTGKSGEVVNRYTEQLRQFHPESDFIKDLQLKDDEFDKLCLQYEPTNKIAMPTF